MLLFIQLIISTKNKHLQWIFKRLINSYFLTESPKVFMENARDTLIKKLTITMRLNKEISIESKKQYMYQCDGQVVNDGNY